MGLLAIKIKGKMEKFLYPVTPETMHEYAAKVLGPIQRGQCVTVEFYPHAGKRTWNKFLIKNLSLFKKELPEQKKFLLFYLDPIELTTESSLGYLQLLYSLIKKENEPTPESYREVFKAIKERVQRLLERGREVVFFLGKFDELKFLDTILANNLKALWEVDKKRVHFVFLVTKEVLSEDFLEEVGELSEALLQNVVSVPLLSEKDVDYSIKRQEHLLSYRFSEKEKEALKKISRGHPYALKLAAQLLAAAKPKDPSKFLKSQYQMQYLLNLIQEKNRKLELNPENQILVSGKLVKPIFSAREYGLLKEFLLRQDQLFSKDKIAEILWGEKESFEKYSDWAMTQMMAALREKISSLGVKPSSIKTIRGEGYVFSQQL